MQQTIVGSSRLWYCAKLWVQEVTLYRRHTAFTAHWLSMFILWTESSECYRVVSNFLCHLHVHTPNLRFPNVFFSFWSSCSTVISIFPKTVDRAKYFYKISPCSFICKCHPFAFLSPASLQSDPNIVPAAKLQNSIRGTFLLNYPMDVFLRTTKSHTRTIEQGSWFSISSM